MKTHQDGISAGILSDGHRVLDISEGGSKIIRPGVRRLEVGGLAALVQFLDPSEPILPGAPGVRGVQLGQRIGVERDETRVAVRCGQTGEEGEAGTKGEDELGLLPVVPARRISVCKTLVPYEDATTQTPAFPRDGCRSAHCVDRFDVLVECGARDDEESVVPGTGPSWGVVMIRSQHPHNDVWGW